MTMTDEIDGILQNESQILLIKEFLTKGIDYAS
jgi:hypothetical protein